MSAEILRRAATLMRERAAACIDNDRAHPEETGGPEARYSPAFIEDAFRAHSPIDPPYSDGCERSWELQGDHLASWHPAVALAVADWLEHEAQIADEDAADGFEMGPRYPGLTVARAYLGES